MIVYRSYLQFCLQSDENEDSVFPKQNEELDHDTHFQCKVSGSTFV